MCQEVEFVVQDCHKEITVKRGLKGRAGCVGVGGWETPYTLLSNTNWDHSLEPGTPKPWSLSAYVEPVIVRFTVNRSGIWGLRQNFLLAHTCTFEND